MTEPSAATLTADERAWRLQLAERPSPPFAMDATSATGVVLAPR